MRGQYFVQSIVGAAYLNALDLVLSVSRPPRSSPGRITRILLGVGGHLGDAVLATSVLPILARAIPDAAIGVAAPSWGLAAFEEHPQVQWLHRVDHWKLNRTIASRWSRLRRSMETHRLALREIRDTGYDAAIDLYPFYPTMSVLFRRAGIPIRIGHDSGGGGPAYTDALPWAEDGEHITATHARLVSILTGQAEVAPGYGMAPLQEDARADAARLLKDQGVDGGYIVLHPGSGDARKSWPTDRWSDVARCLVADGHRVVVTGTGAAERAIAGALVQQVTQLVDLTGRTDAVQLRGVLRGATAAVAVDSVAGHLAAAEGTPIVSIMAGMSDSRRWRPLGSRVSIITHQVACAPCYRSTGCAQMNCVRDVEVEAVLAAVRRAVSA